MIRLLLLIIYLKKTNSSITLEYLENRKGDSKPAI